MLLVEAIFSTHFRMPVKSPRSPDVFNLHYQLQLLLSSLVISQTFIDDWDPVLEVDNLRKSNEAVLHLHSLVTSFHFREVFQVQVIVDGLQSLGNLVGISIGFFVEENNQIVLVFVQEGQQLLVHFFNFAVDL